VDRSEIETLLDSVARGEISAAEAAERLSFLPVSDLGFARVDTQREARTGIAEVVYAEGKTPTQVRAIARAMLAGPGGPVLVTRASAAVFDALRDLTPGVLLHETARVAVLRSSEREPAGTVAVATGGTSDLPVAEEAAVCAEALGAKVDRIIDIGVAGVHRTLAEADRLRAADVVIAIAGMEGALPSLIAGLVSAPVIAVPTSVGYGASFGGLAALLGMLTSCAPGIAVVNIDNGFGAAALALRILRTRA
jgi:pyridinium-3,5-biscarboxylic acid mononucleotide synthase